MALGWVYGVGECYRSGVGEAGRNPLERLRHRCPVRRPGFSPPMTGTQSVVLNVGPFARRLCVHSVVRPVLAYADRQPLAAIDWREERRPGESVAVSSERKAGHGQLA